MNCLVTTGALKKGGITEADYPRFAGKVIEFRIFDLKKEIADFSIDDEVNVLSGMYGPQQRQKYNRNGNLLTYTNIIELSGDTEKDKVKYEYNVFLEVLNLKLGEASLSINNPDTINDVNVYHLSFNVRTTRLGDTIYKIRNKIDVWIDQKSLNVVKQDKNIRELRKKKSSKTIIKDQKGVTNGQEFIVVPNAFDPYSLILILSEFDIKENESKQFEARQVNVRIIKSNSILFKDMERSLIPIIVSHGEGRIDIKNAKELKQVTMKFADNLGDITESYPFNPNGSIDGVTGFCNHDGRVNIMMPHPERLFDISSFSWAPKEWKLSPWAKIFYNAREWMG